MWRSDPFDCWLNTPDVRSADDDGVSGSCSATVNDLLDDFHAAADPSRQSFQHTDVTFQTNPISDTLSSPATPIPLPVLQFYDNEASLEEQLVTSPVLAKTTQPDFHTSAERMTVVDLGLDRPDNGSLSSTMFNSPLSEPRQEQFILIQLPLNSNDLLAVLSRITNNNEFVVDNNSSSEIQHHHHHHHQQQQQEEEAEPTSESHTATSTAAEPSTGDQPHTSGDGETGNDVTKLSEEDVLSMLEDAASIVVGYVRSTSKASSF